MDVLCLLAEEAGNVVPRDTLIERIWQTEFGSDESLTRAVSVIRRTVRELGGSADLVETVPKRGYRLTVPVALASGDSGDSGSVPSKPPPDDVAAARDDRSSGRYGLLWAAALGLGAVAVLALALLADRGADTPDQPLADSAPAASIAVLPFVDLSAEQDQEYFSDGISEEILNALVRIDGLRVAGRTSSFSFKGRDEDLREIGAALNVANVLEGSVRKQGDRVRITAQLINAGDGYHLWSETYDGDLADIFDLQERIAQSVARRLELTLSAANEARLAQAGTDSFDAYELFLEAASPHVNSTRAIKLLDRAILLDPEFSRAYAARAEKRLHRTQWLDANQEDIWPIIESDLQRALAIDPDNALAHGSLGFLYYLQRRFVDMQPAFEAGLAANPQEVRLLYMYQIALISTGRLDQALEVVERLIDLEPLFHWYQLYKGFILYMLGDDEEALRFALYSSELGENTYQQIPGWIAGADGYADAAATLLTESWSLFETGLSAGEMRTVFKGAYGTAADQAAGLETLAGVVRRRGDLYQHRMLPTFYMYLGESDTALDYFYSKPDPMDEVFYGRIWLDVPGFSEFRRSDAMHEFARRTGLLEYWERYGWPTLCAPRPTDPDIPFECE